MSDNQKSSIPIEPSVASQLATKCVEPLVSFRNETDLLSYFDINVLEDLLHHYISHAISCRTQMKKEQQSSTHRREAVLATKERIGSLG